MSTIINKIRIAIDDLEKENSLLLICALFLRKEPLKKWDILISAPWLNPQEMKSYDIVSKKLRNVLGDSDLVKFSRIVLLKTDDPVVLYLQKLGQSFSGNVKKLNEKQLSEVFHFNIKQALLLKCRLFV